MDCFAYLRVSGLGQVDGLGFDRQLAACEAYASANGIRIVQVFREEGVCGATELDNRPALQDMISALLANGTRLVLIEKLDRLARDLIVQETILRDLERKDIRFISAAEPDLCNGDPTRTLIRQILGAFFEYERKMIVSKLADARRRKRVQDGQCEGVRPYGSLPGEEVALRLILSLSACSAEIIANHLNVNGVSSRSGKGWHPSTIRKILARASKENAPCKTIS